MALPFPRAGVLLVCVMIVAGIPWAGRAGAQSEESDAPDAPRAKPEAGGSDVLDDSDKSIGTIKPRKPKAEKSKAEKPRAGKPKTSDDNEAGKEETEPSPPPPQAKESRPKRQPGDRKPRAPVEFKPTNEREPAPDKAEQAAALAMVKEVLAEQYAQKAPEDRIALAATLIEQASDDGNDAATRYVMLREARDLAAGAGDIDSALEAVDGLAGFAGVDAFAMKSETLATVSKKVSNAERAVAVVDGYLTVADEMLAAAEPERAVKLLSLADAVARKAKDADLTARLNQRKKDLKDLIVQFGAAVGPAKAKLAANPADAAALATVGKFYCLVAGDWDQGLPMLARSNDRTLGQMAGDDLAAAEDDESLDAKLKLADGWWDFAEKQKGISKTRAHGRAAHWYLQAVEELAGLERTRVEKRLASIASAGGLATKPGDVGTSAADALERMVRFVPDHARPVKGVPFDFNKLGIWMTKELENDKFDAVLTIQKSWRDNFDGRDSLTVAFDVLGPLEWDDMPYTLRVACRRTGPQPPALLRSLQPGATVRVRGRVHSAGATFLGNGSKDVRLVQLFLNVKDWQLTPVRAGVSGDR